MANFLQGLLSPRLVVGLEVTPKSIGAVQVVNTLKGVEVGFVFSQKVEDYANIDKQLKQAFQNDALHFNLLASCLSGASAFVRQVSLPIRKPAKLEKVIRYQLEPHVPYPVDDMVVDFVVGASDDPITAVGVLKNTVSEHLELLSKGGIHPDAVGLDDLALSSLFLQSEAQRGRGLFAIVNVREDKISFLVLEDGSLRFIRVTSPGQDPVAQIVDTWKLYQARSEPRTMEELLLVGDRPSSDGLPERISSQLEVPASWWRPFDRFRCRSGEVSEELQARLAVPLGLALSAGRGPGKAINLRKEEFRLRMGADLRRPLAVTVCTLLILLGLFTFDVYRKVHLLESQNEALRRQSAELFTKAFPEVTRIVKGQELFQMEQKMREYLTRFQGLGDVADKGAALGLLAELTRILSEVADARVENLSLDGKEVRLDGQADSFEKVDRIKELLSSSKSFEAVKLSGAKMDKRANAVKFNFSMDVK